jgi:hypothetical protein
MKSSPKKLAAFLFVVSTTGKLVYVISRLFYFQNPRYA